MNREYVASMLRDAEAEGAGVIELLSIYAQDGDPQTLASIVILAETAASSYHHLCRNRACVNPDHLEPVTRRTNLLRGDGPRVQREIHERRTHCKRGHAFTPDNTRIRRRDGYPCRICRMCNRLYQAKSWRSQ